MGVIFTAVLLLFVAISVVWSVFVRKLIKTRIRSISIIVCIVLALVGTVAIRDFVLNPDFITGTLLPMLGSSLPAEVSDLLNASTVLLETAIGLPVALISPLIFVILYTVLSILAGIVYLFILFFGGRKLRRSAKNKVPYAKARGIAWSVVSSFLALIVILLPIAFYGDLIDDVIVALEQTDVMDAETQQMVSDTSNEIVESPAIQMFRMFGGDMIIDELASFTANGETISLKNEFSAIAELVGNVMPLTQAGEPQNYGDKEAQSIVDLANSFSKSKFLTVLGSEAVYLLTDDMVNGDEAMLMADNEMFGGLIEKMITIVHDDAKDANKFSANLVTVAEMASELIKGGVLSNMDDTDALMEELAGGDTITNVIIVLGENNSMKCLIPEVTNIGIKAIAAAVEVEEDANALYDELMNTIAADLNALGDLDDADLVSELSPKLNSAFDYAGIFVDKKIINLYSVAMIKDLVKPANAEITALDVQNFFVTFAWSVDEYDANDDRANSAAAVLAQMVIDISALDDTSETFGEQLAAILAQGGSDMLGTTEGGLYDAVVGVTLKKKIDATFIEGSNKVSQYDYIIEKKFYTTSTLESTKALRSAETMKEKSLLIFMDEIVIDVDEAAKLITDETVENEAEAIGGIFSEAGGLMNEVSGDEIDIGTMATSIGKILNSLNDSVCVGEERTTNLFIAIIQSHMVRDTANMNIATATELGVKGTKKNADGTPVDFEKTFKTISNTMNVLQNLNSSTENTEEDQTEILSTVLQDLNPQTAGMMESFITEERLTEDYGVDAEFSSTAAPLISDVFGYWNDPEVNMNEEKSVKEAEALNDVITLVTSANDKANSGTTSESVFGGENSVLGKTADDTVKTFMSSESIKHSLNNNSKDLEQDPFGVGDMMVVEDGEGGKNEKQDLEDAMKKYYATTEYETEEEKETDKETLTNLGKLFGFTHKEMEVILGEEQGEQQ